jgi:hypothetical protein
VTRQRALGVAIVVALVLLVAGRQLGPTRLYSGNGAYRAQVDAMLAGRLALTDVPEGLQHDLAWTDSGVQQVWGLGVPLWQTPFEVAGRAVGVTPFPDRVAMLAWLVLMTYVLIRAWRRPEIDDGEPWWIGAGCVAITALLPGFVTMIRGRVGVYEEAAIYAYGGAMILLGATARFASAPTRARYLVLLAAAGAAGLLRPTVWFYGLGSAIVASAIWLRHRGRRGLVELAIGGVLFVAGGAALYETNAVRFGDGMEFGHRVNLHSLPGNLMATRFSYPFQRVGTGEAALELVTSLFDRPEKHAGASFYQKRLHHGVSTTPRWREYYFTTFTWGYLPVLLVGLVLGALAWRRRAGPADHGDRRWLVAWAVLGGAPLFVFYLHSPSVSSRYQLDLAPAFAALLVIAWRAIAAAFVARGRGGLALGGLAAAWLASIMFARTADPLTTATVSRAAAVSATSDISRATGRPHVLPAAYDLADPWLPQYTDILESYDRCVDETGTPIDPQGPPLEGDTCFHGERAPDAEQWIVWTSVVPPPPPETCAPPDARPVCIPDPTSATAGEVVGVDVPPACLYLNAFRWDLATGMVPPATYVWTSDPHYVEIDLATLDGSDPDVASAVRVAVGRTHLGLASIADTGHGARLRFEARAPLPSGLQVVFLAFGDDTDIDRVRTRFAMTRIRWRDR